MKLLKMIIRMLLAASIVTLVACSDCVGQFNHPGSEPYQHWNNFEYHSDADDRITLPDLRTVRREALRPRRLLREPCFCRTRRDSVLACSVLRTA